MSAQSSVTYDFDRSANFAGWLATGAAVFALGAGVSYVIENRRAMTQTLPVLFAAGVAA